MVKWMRYASLLIITFGLLSFAYVSSIKVEVPEALKVKQPTEFLFPKNKATYQGTLTIMVPPYLGSSYTGFKEALAYRESQGDYFITNSLGYMGKYQFGIGTLNLMGVYSKTCFLNDPILQEKVFYFNIARNKWILRKDIKKYVGKRIRGIQITESGILAAAHLAGPGNIRKYLRSYGRLDKSDAYGTNLSDYLKKFSGYDISKVSPVRNPKV